MAQRRREFARRFRLRGLRGLRGESLDAGAAAGVAPRREPLADVGIGIGLDGGEQAGRRHTALGENEALQTGDVARADRVEAELSFQTRQPLAQRRMGAIAVGIGPEQGDEAGARRRAFQCQPGQQQRVL